MDFGILGPLEVRDGEREVPLGRGKQRALLALLLLHRDQAISTDCIVDELWGERPPPTAAKIVQNYVLQLRRALANDGAADAALVTRGHGYTLRIDSGRLDLDTFEHLVQVGERALRDGEVGSAATTLREALALWRGPPLADFAYEPFAKSAIARLEEQRLATLERRIDADLALGCHADVVGELKELVAGHPLREGFRVQLMLALYRSGRQAEALEVYRDVRRKLIEELGIDPSPALQELQRAILRQKLQSTPESQAAAYRLPPQTAVSVADTASGEDESGGSSTFRGRSGVWLTRRVLIGFAFAAVVSVALATLIFVFGRGSSGQGRTESLRIAVSPNSVAVMDAKTNTVRADLTVGDTPGPIAAGAGAIWVGNEKDQTISRIDPLSRTTVRTIGVGFPINGVAVGQRSIWIASAREGVVYQLDPSTSSVVGSFRFRPREAASNATGIRTSAPVAMVFGGGGLWIADRDSFSLLRINPRTSQITARVADVDAKALALAEGSVWIVSYANQEVVRIDSKKGFISARIPVPANPNGIVVGDEAVWVAHDREGTVSQIDPYSAQVKRTIDRGAKPLERAVSSYITAMAARGGFVWIANRFDHTVSRINEVTLEKSVVDVGRRPSGLVVSRGEIWVTISSSYPF